jgi:serine/threonine-protein kinase HipA
MNICPITYEPCGEKNYSEKGLKMIDRKLTDLKPFPYTKEEQISEALKMAAKMSIQGVQPKLSAKLNIKDSVFEIVDKNGMYILKPQNLLYKQLPQNEDLTMHLAKISKMEVPLHGMIYSKDKSLVYFIRRFDRTPRGKKFGLEDFAQLAGLNRDTKYDFSMERVVNIIERYCTFPEIEKIKLFRLVIFNYLSGNEDAHSKNFSLITRNLKVELSPCYDLVNTTISIENTKEEIALPLNGKKKNLTRKDLIDYYAVKRLNLRNVIVEKVLSEFKNIFPEWNNLISRSFLSEDLKSEYINLIQKRSEILKI